MLTVYRSNRAEWLARILAEQLRLAPPAPFDEVEVMVNTWPTSRWLGEQLAAVNGISALVRFPFPGSRLRQLVRSLDGDATQPDAADDPWRAEGLVWRVLEVLPDLLEEAEAEPLRQWMALHPSGPDQLNRDRWLLARSLADAIDDYALYRPDELERWLNRSGPDPALPTALQWQPLLVQRLARHCPAPPFGLQVRRAVQRLRAGAAPTERLPRQLRLFGISSMAPVQVELLQALSGVIDVQLFLLTPCPDLWQRSGQRRRRLGDHWQAPLDGSWLLEAPRLEAMAGRMGAEFQLLLEGSGDCQLGERTDGDLFAAPMTNALEANRRPSLLEQLQEQLVVAQDTDLQHQAGDESLRFLASPGRWREVQLVRDQILQWLAADPTLQPRDVLVMTPQIDRFAPLLSSVFNDCAATGVALPWRLTDRSQQDSPGLCQSVLQLLEMAGERLTATGLEQLLANPALQAAQQLERSEVEAIHRCLQRCGFRWGLDGRDRRGDPTHSLRWCLDRWLLGLVFDDATTVGNGDTAPFSDGLTPEQLGRWWPLLDRLARWLDRLSQPRRCSDWIPLLLTLLEELYGDGGAWSEEKQAVLAALEGWRERADTCALQLQPSVVVAVLREALARDSGRFGHRSGAVTISALEPMRAIPHRVIILMGLDASSFPRQSERPGFHLLEQQRRLGDPSPSDQDRYALLEALLSARQHLLISWNARDERRGETLPPAAPVQQWLSLLEEQLGPDAMTALRLQPAANPLDPSNFQPQAPGVLASCDQRLLLARRCLDQALRGARGAAATTSATDDLVGLALPLHWTLSDATAEEANGSLDHGSLDGEQVERWLMAPQRVWLEEQGLRPQEWLEPIEDFEALDLAERDRQALLQERLQHLIDQLPEAAIVRGWSEPEPGHWLERSRGRGWLPPGAAAAVETDRLEQRWQSLQSTLLQVGSVRRQGGRLVAGDTLVVAQPGRLRARGVLRGWWQHLQAQAAAEGRDTVMVARDTGKSGSDGFAVALCWRGFDLDQAAAYLHTLQACVLEGWRNCWPVPPESGLARALQLHKGEDAANRAFRSQWQGDFQAFPERERPEMRLCFGEGCDSEQLLEAPGFEAAFQGLYQPLVEHLQR